MSILCGRYSCKHCLGEVCQFDNIQINVDGQCAFYDCAFARSNKPIIDLFEKDPFYVVENNRVGWGWIKKIDRVVMLREDKQPRIEADCAVSFPGSPLQIPRRYTFCEQTINKTLFIGENAKENAEKSLVNIRKENITDV